MPTLTAFSKVPEMVDAPIPSEVLDWLMTGWAGQLPTARAAHEAGVTVLAGTDGLPFGNITTEVDWLLKAGLPAEVAAVPPHGQHVTGSACPAGFPTVHPLIWSSMTRIRCSPWRSYPSEADHSQGACRVLTRATTGWEGT